MQRTVFVDNAPGGGGNKPAAIGILTISSVVKSGEGDTTMSDERLLLDHARRYFTQAGQASDVRKMKMLAELGLEFISLAQSGGRARSRAGAPPESTEPSPASEQGGTDKSDS